MRRAEDLEERARLLAARLVEQAVETSEEVDFRSGTYLLAAVAAELAQQIGRRCEELARSQDSRWELAVGEAETLIGAAWRCMATIDSLSGESAR